MTYFVSRCDHCDQKFAMKSMLQRHINAHEPSELRSFQCSHCSKTYSDKKKLKYHITVTHCAEEDKNFHCVDCGKRFFLESSFRHHVKAVHEMAYAQICDVCARMFKNKTQFDIHREQHENIVVPQVQCNVCGAW